ncbi:MAG: hypothetical protein OEM26_11895 [Saprospiraceae bacterium]|nr:hypothetical protein [Saprospiraceae bacterium]
MKNLFNCLVMCILLAVALGSCAKEATSEIRDCTSYSQEISETLNAYVADPNVENCKAYLSALRRYLEDGACFSELFHDEYKRELAELEQASCQ